MEGRVDSDVATDRPWQAGLCQFFTRDKVATLCLRHVSFPEDPLVLRLLEPAAGQGAFILPLLRALVEACCKQGKSYDQLRPVIRAYEIDPDVAATLRDRCAEELNELGVAEPMARGIARAWIKNEDFLEARPRTRFTHIVGNPPYIRWDAIPAPLRASYRERFSSFKQRADLYIAFIERSLELLEPGGQLAFLCPGTWTRNVYGGSIREAFTSLGHLKAIVDFSDVDSFETPADAYPHFFVFEHGTSGSTKILSMAGTDTIIRSGSSAVRTFAPSSSPLVLSRDAAAEKTLEFARRTFPRIEDAGCGDVQLSHEPIDRHAHAEIVAQYRFLMGIQLEEGLGQPQVRIFRHSMQIPYPRPEFAQRHARSVGRSREISYRQEQRRYA
ncbi:Eco57I restriction-modification methylase domain-containing protein [Mesorhizobium sp. M0601]|uniref:Eco57I restriction-modification methylase domain-containing protein n=1 Tax=Mesorhizobium sp. M0601 TaxID=2956969 RepID=UPI00333CF9C3